MPYESGMDPIHDTRRRFDVRFYLLAIAFLVFDVELLFLYPWAVAMGEGREAEWQSASGEGTRRQERRRDTETRRCRVNSRFALRTPYSLSSPSLPHPCAAASRTAT